MQSKTPVLTDALVAAAAKVFVAAYTATRSTEHERNTAAAEHDAGSATQVFLTIMCDVSAKEE